MSENPDNSAPVTVSPSVGGSAASPDYSLLLARLEQDLLAGLHQDRCRAILSKSIDWQGVAPEVQLQWARLCQMAGEVDVALQVLNHLTTTRPRYEQGWRERIELLALLDRREQVGSALAASRSHLALNSFQELVAICRRTLSKREEEDLGLALSPFAAFRTHQTAIARYMNLFCGREDCFARQWANAAEAKCGYAPVRRPMEPADIDEHLAGRKTYGIYLMRPDSTVKVGLIDADLIQQYRHSRLKPTDMDLLRRERNYLLDRVRDLSHNAGLRSVPEFSGGKGFHFWYLFENPVAAALVKTSLEIIQKRLAPDLTTFKLEVFPKQEQLSGKGFGNLVKLPLGVHRLTGKRSFFLACSDRSSEAQLEYLGRVVLNGSDSLKPAVSQTTENVVMHPRFKDYAQQYPELYQLEQLCPPLAHIMASCRNGESLTVREEKVLYQTVGFLPRKKTLLHFLLTSDPAYNPHLVDYRLSRLRGTPIGCGRIHALLSFEGDYCRLQNGSSYPHPLLHLGREGQISGQVSERVENMTSALENLQAAIEQVKRFIK
jgi:hypothetical protein